MRLLSKTLLAGAILFAVLHAAVIQAQTTTAENNPVLARVGETEIRLNDLVREAQTLPQQYQNVPLQAIFEPLLQRMIARVLVVAAAEAKELDQREDVAKEIARNRSILLQQAYMQDIVAPAVTESEVKNYYEKEVASQPGTPEVRARHILLESEAEAQTIAEKARGGADFAELAKAHSTGPSKTNGGDLGFFKASDMVAPFSSAAFAMQPGEISDPVQTRFGWHVIKVEERRDSEPPSFDESVERIRQDLSQQAMQVEIARLRDATEIELFNPDGSAREAGDTEGDTEKKE